MRTYVMTTLLAAFVLFAGACAGRQARTPSIPASPRAELPAPAPVTAPEAETPAAEQAPVVATVPVESDEDLRVRVQRDIDRYVAEEIAAHNAAVREAAEKLHRIHVPPPLPHEEEIVAALRIDPDGARKLARETDEDYAAMLAGIHEASRRSEPAARLASRSVAAKPRPKPEIPKIEDDGRPAVGVLAAPPPPAIVPAVTAALAPSDVPVPQGAPSVIGAEPAKAAPAQGVPMFFPDTRAVDYHRAYGRRLVAAAAVALALGLCCGLMAAFLRSRRMRVVFDGSYKDLPDGAMVVHEIVGGRVVAVNVVMPNPTPPRSEPEAGDEKAMDAIEDAWNAEGDAMGVLTEDETPGPASIPTHDRFDLTDTQPDAPSAEPAPDAAPPFADGSGRMISSSDRHSVSGVAHAPDPPPEPGLPDAPSIIFDDGSATIPDQFAASDRPN